MKKFFAVLLVLALALALAACGGGSGEGDNGDWAKVEAAGKLVIGMTDYEPMNYYAEDGTVIGFDTELAQAVCAKLGVEAEFVEIIWDNKQTELDSGNIDCIWNGMTYSDEREETMDYTSHYMYNDQVIVIRSEDAALYATTADLAGANLTAEAGSAGEGCITADESLSQANYVGASNMANALLEVSAHTSDAAVVDSVMAYYLCGNGVYEGLTVLGDIVLASEEYGAAFRTGSDLVAKVNQALDELWADGTIQTIAEKYSLDAKLIDLSAN